MSKIENKYQENCVNLFPDHSDELKKINISIAREYGSSISKHTIDDFYHTSALKLLNDAIFKHIKKEIVKASFFEYSTLCSTIDSRGLSAFICLSQNGDYFKTATFIHSLNNIIDRLYQRKLSLYYLTKFFLNPEDDYGYYTVLPRDSDLLKDEKFISYLNSYNATDSNVNYEKTRELEKIACKGSKYIQNLAFQNITYEEVTLRSKEFSKDLPIFNHLLLHHLYDSELLSHNGSLITILISIPMLGAPIFGNTDSFNGQGAFFLYMIVDSIPEKKIIDNLVIEISNLNRDITYNYLFEVGYIKAKEANRAAVKSAIIQYMARNLSHNTGSHLIPEAIIYFRGQLDIEKGDEFIYYQKYTQERMELLAQLSSMKNNHNWTNYNLREVINEFNHSIIPKGLCDDLNNNQKEIDISMGSSFDDVYVLLPDGAVGKQALYVILENFIRNTYKHANAESSYLFEINVSEPEIQGKEEYWCIDIYDKLGSLNEQKRTKEKLNEINEMINSSVLTKEAQLRNRGWGLLEMKSSAAFLIGYPLEQIDKFPLIDFEIRYYTLSDSGSNINLGHRFFLKKPKLLVIDIDLATELQKAQKNNLRNKGITICSFTDEDFRKEPHQFVITNKAVMFSNQKILTSNIDTEYSNSQIENDLWESHINKQDWNKVKIISQNEQTCEQRDSCSYFDWHGKSLTFNGSCLKDATADKIRNLKLNFYHPWKSRSGIGSLITKSKTEARYRGLLLETISKRILIIDERIQNSSQSKDNDQTNLTLQEIFSFMGIIVPLKNELNLSDYLENPNDEKRDRILNLILDNSFDYVVLHLTILEQLASTYDKNRLGSYIESNIGLNEIENFTNKKRALILVSGRGEPPNLPINSYYMNYTTLYDCIIYSMSKPHLIQILNSLRKR